MKKFKFLALILAAVFAVTTFASCSGDDDSDNDSVTLPSDTDNNGGSSASGGPGSSSGAGGSSTSGGSGATSTNGIPAAAAFGIKTNDTSNKLGAALAKLGKGEVLPSGVYGNIKVGVYEYSGKYLKISYGAEQSAVRADEDTVYLNLKAQTVERKEGYNLYSDGGCIMFNVKKGAKITITGKAALNEHNQPPLATPYVDLNGTLRNKDGDDLNKDVNKRFEFFEDFSEETFTSNQDGEFVIYNFNLSGTDAIISEIKVEY